MGVQRETPALCCGGSATRLQREKADGLFDHLSSLLREATEPDTDPAVLIREADRAFGLLHQHLSSGGVLPQPWRDARH